MPRCDRLADAHARRLRAGCAPAARCGAARRGAARCGAVRRGAVILAPRGDGDCVSIHLHVDNADAMAERAVTAGAALLSTPIDEFCGERGCRLRDRFGHAGLIGASQPRLTGTKIFSPSRWTSSATLFG